MGHYLVHYMSSRRLALLIGTVVGLIAIISWVAEIDLVFQESSEEQGSDSKSLVTEEALSGQEATRE